MSRSRRAEPARLLAGFEPVGAAHARILVLGTMPGRASLAAAEYYAHPRNAFWPIMERLYGVGHHLPYPVRLRTLADAGVALWDVLAHCERSSSLDSDIDPDSARPNDLRAFLARHPGIHTIGFNGTPARRLFDRLVLPDLGAAQQAIPRLVLPSTSPTNARQSFDAKLQAWTVLHDTGAPRRAR